MDGRVPPSSTSNVSSDLPPPRQNLRSSVSMFIQDSRITAVANAEPPRRAPSSFYSVTSFSSSSGPGPTESSSLGGRRASWNLRSTFGPVPDSPRPRACSSSPVRFPGGRGGSSGREVIHNIIREGVEARGDCSFETKPQPRLPPPPSTVRRRATLNVEPVVSVINVKESFPFIPQAKDDRAYTSVNLTLRSPSTGPSASGGAGSTLITTTSSSPSRGGCPSGVGGGGGGRFSSDTGGVNVVNTVVDMDAGGATFRHVHSSSTGGASGGSGSGEIHHHHLPTNLMYSTFSNSKDGFEAQVQIQFGPGGGTFTASRRRRNQISVRQMNSDLLSAQSDRRDKLRNAIQERKCVLATLQTEIAQLNSQFHQQRSPFTELEKLKKENQRLRIQCGFMTKEVDLYQNGSVPLGETDEEFYEGINPGQSIDALFGITNNRRKVGGRGGVQPQQPPPRPPPPKFLQSPTSPLGGAGAGVGGGEGDQGEWKCSMCTFQNHRDLDYCEQCQMVRVKQPQPLHGPN